MHSYTNLCLRCQTVPSVSPSLLSSPCALVCARAFKPYRYCSVRHFVADTINHWSIHADTQPDVHSRSEAARGNKQVFLRAGNDKDALITFLMRKQTSRSRASFLFVFEEICRTGLIENTHFCRVQQRLTLCIRDDRRKVSVAKTEPPPPKAYQKHKQSFWSETEKSCLCWCDCLKCCVGFF